MSETKASDLKIGQHVKFGTYRQDAIVTMIWPGNDEIVKLQTDYRSLVCNVNQIYTDEVTQ